MDKAGTRLLVTRSSPDQPPQVYLADDAASGSTWVEENKLDANHPYAPYLASHRRRRSAPSRRPDGTHALLEDDHAAARAGQALPGVLRTLWRPGPAAGDDAPG